MAEPLSRIGQLFVEGTRIDAAIRAAAREAWRRHKREGLPLVIYRNGEVVLVPPEELEASLGDA